MPADDDEGGGAAVAVAAAAAAAAFYYSSLGGGGFDMPDLSAAGSAPNLPATKMQVGGRLPPPPTILFPLRQLLYYTTTH